MGDFLKKQYRNAAKVDLTNGKLKKVTKTIKPIIKKVEDITVNMIGVNPRLFNFLKLIFLKVFFSLISFHIIDFTFTHDIISKTNFWQFLKLDNIFSFLLHFIQDRILDII